MPKTLGSAELFLAQVGNHVAELAQLMSTGPQQQVAAEDAQRTIVATTMLSNSAALLELKAFEQCLVVFRDLLLTHRERGLPWDERIAQLTSEIIDHEESLMTCEDRTSTAAIAQAVSEEVLAGVMAEAQALQTEAMLVEAPAVPRSTELAASGVRLDRPLGHSMEDLRRCAQSLLAQWGAGDWVFHGPDTDDFSAIRRDLFLINFYAQSVEQIIGIKTGDHSVIRTDSLFPIRSAVEDFARVLCEGTSRRVDLSFQGEGYGIDARLMFSVVHLLQWMIGDIFARCDDEYLHVEVVVEERHGHLRWSIRDNGNNFMADSHLDPDEHMAFYPSLKRTSRVLSELNSPLWVEPDHNRDTRFAFTMPNAPDGGRFMTWGEGQQAFAVHAHQVCDVIAAAEATIREDESGDFIVFQRSRVPLVRLGHMYADAPADGRYIVVVGSLEKRIALYVPDTGRLEDGEWLRTSLPSWRELDRGVALVGGRKLPLVEAGTLVGHYLDILNASEERDPGRANPNQPVVPDPAKSAVRNGAADVAPGPAAQSSATAAAAAPSTRDGSPRAGTAPADEPAVLVIEESSKVQEEIAGMLARRNIGTKLFRRLDDAVAWLQDKSPAVIISEFRTPSMAAKAIVERLQRDGRVIPVFVTTTHTGETAELLVSKIGATGFISKPINESELFGRLEGATRRDVASTSRR